MSAVFVRHDHTDLAACVNVRSDLISSDNLEVRYFDLLADDPGVADQLFSDRTVFVWQCHDIFFRLAAMLGSHFRKLASQRNELVVLSDKVGFAAKCQQMTAVFLSLTKRLRTPSVVSRSARLAATSGPSCAGNPKHLRSRIRFGQRCFAVHHAAAPVALRRSLTALAVIVIRLFL